MLARRREYLYLGGFLSSSISLLFRLSFASSIFGGYASVFKFELYFGLLVFLGYMVVDTQEIIEKAHLGDLDYVNHSLTLFTDLVAVFVRVLIIMLKNSCEKEEKKRKKRSKIEGLGYVSREKWMRERDLIMYIKEQKKTEPLKFRTSLIYPLSSFSPHGSILITLYHATISLTIYIFRFLKTMGLVREGKKIQNRNRSRPKLEDGYRYKNRTESIWYMVHVHG
ncbi:hypothetical protein MKX01_039465 [Papaver californicum]|nr:hypothetical protein MKX01_039465 [Papaver californicum]